MLRLVPGNGTGRKVFPFPFEFSAYTGFVVSKKERGKKEMRKRVTESFSWI